MKNIEISIIIPLYKGKRFCNRLLDMIEKNCLYRNFYKNFATEVIFINDYPDEKFELQLKANHFNTRFINQVSNIGIHGSRVRGIKESLGKYIVMLDQDDLVKENWLFSQWNILHKYNAKACVCNGWIQRFRVMWTVGEDACLKINNLDNYLVKGNQITSPGQVMIEKSIIPKEWLNNIQKCNGADDFLLWIMMLKNKVRFTYNSELLFFHTPERTMDSINSRAMLESLKETQSILNKNNILDCKEIVDLNKQITNRMFWEKDCLNEQDLSNPALQNIRVMQGFLKKSRLLKIMFDWFRLKNRNNQISTYLYEHRYYEIAIYGMGNLGECLYEDLLSTNINVKYAIDRSAVDFNGEVPVYRLEDNLEKVDLVIISILDDNEIIIKELENKINCSVITISQLLLQMSDVHR